MKNITAISTAMGLVLLSIGGSSIASSHREAPGITKMPKVDNTDVYAFRSYEPGRESYVTLITNFQPSQEPGDGPNYFTMDPDALYDIHVDNDGDAIADLTFRFRFTNTLSGGKGKTVNVGGAEIPIPLRAIGPVAGPGDANLGETETYSVGLIRGNRGGGSLAANTSGTGPIFYKPFDNSGNKTIADYPSYAKKFVYSASFAGCSGPSRVFAGQRSEAFAVNTGPIFDLVDFVPIDGDSAPGANDGRGFRGGITQSADNQQLIGKKNVTSLAIEVPTSCLTGDGNGVIGVWSTASLPGSRMGNGRGRSGRNDGPYVQVSRLGMPLVNEVVIGLPQKDLFNSVDPTKDGALLQYVTNPAMPALLDVLFRAPVNATLRTRFATLAPTNFPRKDLVAAFLTGFPTLNQMKKVTPSEMQRLNTAVPPTARDRQNPFGVVGDDLAGFPNGRRPGDDTLDVVLRTAMGRLCYPVPIKGKMTDLGLCRPSDAPTGQVAYTDGAPSNAKMFMNSFPYLNPPLRGGPRPQNRP